MSSAKTARTSWASCSASWRWAERAGRKAPPSAYADSLPRSDQWPPATLTNGRFLLTMQLRRLEAAEQDH